LQDHDRALIVGRPTFGKSLLMRGFPMADGSVLVLVVGRVRTPCGRIVQREYHSITRREYYRMARADRDTAGRPSCRTDAGRVAYGGGGVFPDVSLAETPAPPRWVLQAREQQLPLAWSGGYVDAHAASLASFDAFDAAGGLSAASLADFRSYALRQGVTVPPDADGLLQTLLMASVARARWGMEGAYRVQALHDAAVREAVASFARAEELLKTR
jgi:carboxyl-terminal processing protease